MLVFEVSKLTRDEIDALGTIAVMFRTGTIEETIAECINACYETAVDDQAVTEIHLDMDADDDTELGKQIAVRGDDNGY